MKLTDKQVMMRLQNLSSVAEEADFWLTNDGQQRLAQLHESQSSGSLCPLDYTTESKAMLCPVSPSDKLIGTRLSSQPTRARAIR